MKKRFFDNRFIMMMMCMWRFMCTEFVARFFEIGSDSDAKLCAA